MHKIKGGETFHLVAIQPPVRGIVDLFNIGLVTECRILGKSCNGIYLLFIRVQGAWKGTCPQSWIAEWCRQDFP